MEKKEIRELIFFLRDKCHKKDLLQRSHMICQKIIRCQHWKNSSCVYLYMDCKNEVSVRPLLEHAWKTGKRVAVPKVLGKEMKFFYITSYQDVKKGYFGIEEPLTRAEAKEEDALMIMPGVAFDRKRHRCGYGGGFYDRYLSRHGEHFTISPAFDFQIMDAIPHDSFDILPSAIITEQETISAELGFL